jgi:hypothetical protein
MPLSLCPSSLYLSALSPLLHDFFIVFSLSLKRYKPIFV